MRILKYILLWVILLVASISVFVYTQPDMVDITLEKSIPLDKKLSFHYINHLKYWPKHEKNELQNADSLKLHFDFIIKEQNYKGFFHKNDYVINQQINFLAIVNNIESEITLTFQEKENNSLIKWQYVSDLNYFQKLSKMLGFFKPEKTANDFLEFYSQELNQKIISDFNFKSHETEGVIKLASYYAVAKDTLGNKKDIELHKTFLISKIKKTFDTISVKTYGKPILLNYQTNSGLMLSEVQIKIEPNEITSLHPDVFKLYEEQNVLKIVFQGDIKQRNDIEKILRKELTTLDLTTPVPFKIMRIERVNHEDSLMPFEWITEFYIPVIKKPIWVPAQITEYPTSENISIEEKP
jgi:hypothetical protein